MTELNLFESQAIERYKSLAERLDMPKKSVNAELEKWKEKARESAGKYGEPWCVYRNGGSYQGWSKESLMRLKHAWEYCTDGSVYGE